MPSSSPRASRSSTTSRSGSASAPDAATPPPPSGEVSEGASARAGGPGHEAPAAGGPARESGVRRVAAIDIGSNSIRQIVADVSPDGTIRVLEEMKEAPRLGAGLGAGDVVVLADDAMSRAIDAVTRMATLARKLGADHVE